MQVFASITWEGTKECRERDVWSIAERPADTQIILPGPYGRRQYRINQSMVGWDQFLILVLPAAFALRVFQIFVEAKLLGFAGLTEALPFQETWEQIAGGGMKNVWLILRCWFGLVRSVHGVLLN
jgi:hypothetical protein